MSDTESRAVSPMLGLFLLVGMMVLVSASVGFFVFNLGNDVTKAEPNQELGVRITFNDTHATAQVVTGTSDNVVLLVNGEQKATAGDVSPGTTLSAPAPKSSSVSVTATKDGATQVITQTTSRTQSSVEKTGESVDDGLVSQWTLDGDLTDSSGTNDGSETGGVSFTTETSRPHVASFDGSDDKVNFGKALNTPNDSITISVWVYADSLSSENGYNRILTKYAGGTEENPPGAIILGVDDTDSPRLFLSDSGGTYYEYTSSSSITTGQWYLVTGVFDAGEVRLYINGSLEGTHSHSETTIPTYDQSWSLAEDTPTGTVNEYWDGHLDETRLYDTALSTEQVGDLYNQTK